MMIINKDLIDLGDSGFFKKLLLTSTFLFVTPIVIFSSLITLLLLPGTKNKTGINSQHINEVDFISNSGVSIYASLPATSPKINSYIEVLDARPEYIRKYLRSYHSPLEPYASQIVEYSDKNNIDYRLIVAIAQQESNLCKVIPNNTYNCWGWGIHSKGTLGFDSYSHGIETVINGIKTEYIDKGFTSVNDIMSKYTPHSDGSWAVAVESFMYEIENI